MDMTPTRFQRASAARADTIRVLVVGISDPVASQAYSLLSEAGFDVLSAGDTARALDMCRWTLRPIDVVVLFDGAAGSTIISDLPAAATGIQHALPCVHLTAREASDRELLLQRVRRAAAH